MNKRFIFAIVLSVVISLFSAVLGETPNLINYQGYLTDASGDPLVDGNYLVKFTIYDAPTSGTDLWNSGYVPVTTSDGLFQYELGSTFDLPAGIFSDSIRWLGITVGVDPELSPRSRLITVPYSFHSQTATFADSAGAVTDNFVNETGDTLSGDIVMQNLGKTYFETDRNNYAISTFDADGELNSYLWGPTYGELILYDADSPSHGTVYLGAGAGGSSGSYLYMYNSAFTREIGLFPNASGDNSVAFEDDAINDDEIINEPGIAHGINYSGLNLTTTVQAVDTISITIPTDGYIVVQATGWMTLDFEGSSAYIRASISTSPSSLDYAAFAYQNLSSAMPVAFYYDNFSITKVVAGGSGTYTFYLTADADVDAGGGSKIARTHLLATFYPTSYGSVTAAAPPISGSDFSKTADGSDLNPEIQDLREEVARLKAQVKEQNRLILEEQKKNQKQNQQSVSFK